MRLMRTLVVGFIVAASPALADIPVNDAAQLTQHSETAGTTVKLVPVMTQRKDAHSGVKCAVTTGKKADITNPTTQPQAGVGAQKIQSYGPDLPLTPNATAQGSGLNSQTLFQSSGTVVGGLDASRTTMSNAQSAFQISGQQVGTGQTVMAAIDMNSATRLSNNLAWNNVSGSANLWVLGLNALNLARTSDMSRAALGMRTTVPQTPVVTGPVCPVGMIGSGTAADPCHTASTCQTTPPGTPADPACVSARYIDSNGNVLFFLSQIQNAANAATTLNSR